MNSCFDAAEFYEFHCATGLTGGALRRADDNQFFQEVSECRLLDVCSVSGNGRRAD
jgi:hypothetical protein